MKFFIIIVINMATVSFASTMSVGNLIQVEPGLTWSSSPTFISVGEQDLAWLVSGLTCSLEILVMAANFRVVIIGVIGDIIREWVI